MSSADVYSRVRTLLDEIESVSNGDLMVRYMHEGKLSIWKRPFRLPIGCDDLFIVVPQQNEKIQLPKSVASSKHYVVDCFGTHRPSDKTITADKFFDFFCNSNRYVKYFTKNVGLRQIRNLYTDRTISFFNNEEPSIFSEQEDKTLEARLTDWKQSGRKPLLILGDRGIGKSWSVQKFCMEHLDLHRNSPWEHPLPLYLNLRWLSEDNPPATNFGELLLYHLTTLYKIDLFGDQRTFSALLRTGRILLVLDGLDEMSKEVSDELKYKNLWQIFSLYSDSSKFLLTSRHNFFSSNLQIYEHFAFGKYVALRAGSSKKTESIYNLEEQRIRQNFNIWTIDPFEDRAKLKFLTKVQNLSDERLDNGRKKYDRLAKSRKNTIQRELYDLCNVPGFMLPLLRMLAANSDDLRLVDIFETCLESVIIDFNIDGDRAIDKFKTIDNSTANPAIKVTSFRAQKKNEILRKLSWYMIERNSHYFNIDEFPRFIKEVEGNDFDVVLNDLQTQTVITLDKTERRFTFLTPSIFAFYVASYLFFQLWAAEEDEVLRGIRNLGRYDLQSTLVWRKVKVFLTARISSAREREGLTKSGDKRDVILKLSKKIFTTDGVYSPWLQYLSNNLRLIGLPLDENLLRKRDFWVIDPLSSSSNKTDAKMVLISGHGMNPFFLGVTEVTNEEYGKFLNSNEFSQGTVFGDCHGRYWRRHQERSFSDGSFGDNPYKEIINYYHIIHWTNGKMPPALSNHPIVWISWFAAAKYCNWLSLREKLVPYYSFEADETNPSKFARVTVRGNSWGYRLPTEKEWKFAARSGDLTANSLYDLFKRKRDREMLERKFFVDQHQSTSPVKNEHPNRFGVYGLMGNVREWADVDWDERKERGDEWLDQFGHQVIKGMGWLVGKKGFEFEYRSELLAQNTNIDLGFRIARSLSRDEREKIDHAS